MLRLYHYIDLSIKRLFVFGVLVGAVLFLIDVGFAYALQAFLSSIGILDLNSVQIPDWIPTSSLSAVLLFVFALGTTRGLLQWAQFSLQGIAYERVKYLQRKRMLDVIFQSESVSLSETTSLFDEKSSTAGSAIMGLQGAAMQLTAGIFVTCALFYLSPQMSAIAIPVLFLIGLPLRQIDRTISQSGMGLADEWNKAHSNLIVSIKNFLLLQIYGTRELEKHRTREALDAHQNHMMTYYRLAGLKFAVPQVVGIALICGMTYWIKAHHLLASSAIVSYFYLFVRFVQNFADLSKTTTNFRMHWPQLQELITWWEKNKVLALNKPAPQITSTNTPESSASSPLGWKLEDLSFSYHAHSQPILNHFSLEILPGKCLIIVGPSGTGKSTLLNILLGLSTAQSGRALVSVNGINQPIKEVFPKELSQVGYVGPVSFLIEGSLKQNLVYGLTTTPTPETIEQVLRDADCGFIDAFPNRLDHVLTEQGQGLSAGQKQRLALARALLRKPKALLLDEATANLDLETENRLLETLKRLKGKMTIIAVTHRPTLLALGDQQLILGTD